MKTIRLTVILAICFFVTHHVSGQGANTLIPFASGLSKIVGITNAGDNRLFVVGQRGTINIVSSDGIVSSQPFLDISDRVVYGSEQGLLGVAFHPQYKTNGYFFVNYIGKGDSTHISRFKSNPGNQNLADSQTELKLMTIAQPFSNHNGGDLCFGPDGYLYIGLGDGGSGGDPGNRAQNPKQFLGKMLRIDVDNGNPYSIPVSNPYYSSTTVLPEIWAVGLRNPWRFSFDRLTGDLWIADVGQNAVEEVNFQPADSKGGENYGWRCYEGNQAYNSSGCVPNTVFTFPAYAYPQDEECSVTGGYVYRGSASSPFYGKYFFTDYCSDRIWTLHKVGDIWIKEDFGRFAGNNFTTFGEDASGQLYIAGMYSGKIFRINDKTTGSENMVKPIDIKITHVPFSQIIRIETGNNNMEELQISIYDVNGTKHYEKNILENNFEFNPGPLAPGIYFLKVSQNGRSQIQKIVLGK
jgi:glucose/arabinose dehydrogenase